MSAVPDSISSMEKVVFLSVHYICRIYALPSPGSKINPSPNYLVCSWITEALKMTTNLIQTIVTRLSNKASTYAESWYKKSHFFFCHLTSQFPPKPTFPTETKLKLRTCICSHILRICHNLCHTLYHSKSHGDDLLHHHHLLHCY